MNAALKTLIAKPDHNQWAALRLIFTRHSLQQCAAECRRISQYAVRYNSITNLLAALQKNHYRNDMIWSAI